MPHAIKTQGIKLLFKNLCTFKFLTIQLTFKKKDFSIQFKPKRENQRAAFKKLLKSISKTYIEKLFYAELSERKKKHRNQKFLIAFQ